MPAGRGDPRAGPRCGRRPPHRVLQPQQHRPRRLPERGRGGGSLAADAIGRGYATEALGALLDLAFAPAPLGVGLHRVQANIMPANARSLALAERCGMRREGYARAMLQIAGRWEDHIMFAKLADEHAPTGAILGPAAFDTR